MFHPATLKLVVDFVLEDLDFLIMSNLDLATCTQVLRRDHNTEVCKIYSIFKLGYLPSNLLDRFRFMSNPKTVRLWTAPRFSHPTISFRFLYILVAQRSNPNFTNSKRPTSHIYMRAIIQRVSAASVTGIVDVNHGLYFILTEFDIVNNEMISQISQGLMVLVGIGTGMKSLRSQDTAHHNI